MVAAALRAAGATRGPTLLQLAARRGDVLEIDAMLRAGACDLEARCGCGGTALGWAAAAGQCAAVEALLKSGAAVDAEAGSDDSGDNRRSEFEEVPLMLAVRGAIYHAQHTHDLSLIHI